MSRFLRRPIRLFDPSTPPGISPAPAPAPAPDPAEGLRNLLARNNNDAMAMAGQLYAENYQLRARNRELTSAQPAEGSVVLSREHAAQWAAYTQLGAPDALTTQLSQAQTASQELTALKRQGLYRDVGEVAGWKASVLAQLPGAADLTFAIKDVTVDGKAVKQAFVTPKDGAEVALSAYAQQHWADFLPALQMTAPAPTGTPFPAQQPSGGQPALSPVDAFAQRMQQRAAAAPNPLARKA